LLPDWNPQRSILLIGALSLAVPMRRVFLAPYLVVTAYALALTLGHGGELGAGLFAPLTERALDVPPIDDFFGGSILKTSLLWPGIVAWMAALFQFWRSRREPAIDFTPPTILMPLLALTLVSYLVVCFALAPLGVERTPFVAAASQEVPAGQPLTVTFFAQQRDWRGFAFPVLSGEGNAQISLLDGAGQSIVKPATVDIAPGENWVDMPNDIASRPQPFSAVIVPEQPLTIEMAQVPENLPIAWSDLAGKPLPGAPAFTLRFETTWRGLMSDATDRMRDEWPTFALSLVVCLGLVATLYTTGLRERASEERERIAAGFPDA